MFGTSQHGVIVPGLLEKAVGGLLYLGDAGNMNMECQRRLNTYLTKGTFTRVHDDTHTLNMKTRIVLGVEKEPVSYTHLHLQTQEISKALGRGKHTTRHCELWKVKEGWVADTPGFSSLDFSTMDMHELADCIPDFKPYQGMCKFRDCIHRNEPDCAVSQAVDEKKIVKRRYMHYLDILDMIEQTKTKYR